MDFSALPTLLASNPLLAFPLVFAGGLLTSLTPCIYPMIPITAAIVGGSTVNDAAGGSGVAPARIKVIVLTFSYVVGLAGAYAALGLFAGLTGSLFGGISTNPWLYLVMGNLLIIFALMMLDVIPVLVPGRMMARAAALKPRHRAAGAFGMGAASGVVAAPCGAPVFAAVLTWVATTQSAVLGFAYLFVFALGMCALLVVVGLSSGGVVNLPKAGGWMVWVKRGFAVLMLIVAEYYLVQMGKLLI